MIITTGIQNAPVVCRQEIRNFLKDKDVTNLYLLALSHMQEIPQQDPTSWFQLAGIHGRPYVAYDNVTQKGTFGGYCTHSSILFPTWHRPYLALFEQQVAAHIHRIAHQYKNPASKKRYLEALERFRLPYWDWATESTLPDLIAHHPMVFVDHPDGTRHQIKNPLYAYNFNPVYDDFGDGVKVDDGTEDEKTWESWQSTVRYPTSKDDKAKSEHTEMQTTLENNRLTLRDRTYNLLTQKKPTYAAFSHDSFAGNDQHPLWWDSIEAIHGQIHGLAGRNGHMGVVDFAAFDPVFWLHHANVDRIFALWQGLHPDVWITEFPSATGTFTRPAGEPENSKSPLTPFRRNHDNYWDSDGVRDTRVFNYTYPELDKWSSLDKDKRRKRLVRHINRLYGHSAPVAKVANKVFKELNPAAGTAAAPTPSAATPVAPAPAGEEKPITLVTSESSFEVTTGDIPEWDKNDTTDDDLPHYHEWIANIIVEKYAVKSTFFVHLFLGAVDDNNPAKWGSARELVGTHVVFANNAETTGCARCRDAHEKHKLVTATVPLTGCLGVRLGGIDKLEPKLVLPYLQTNLHWRVQKHDGTPIPTKNVPGLKISVGQAIVLTPQTADEFPEWTKCSINSEATANRQGGA